MFHELLLSCIAREVNTRLPKHNLRQITSLDSLPRDLKKQLKLISTLAYEGVVKNKIVFTQDELPSILPKSSWHKFLSKIRPTSCSQQDLPAMGVLQRVQWVGTNSKAISYNFVHLSIQEMLAAYRISRMRNDEQVRVFTTLRGNPRFVAVLQFYAGFTKLTNRGVRNIITSSYVRSSQISLLSGIRCLFEAQISDPSLYEEITRNGSVHLVELTLSPSDCLSVGYFLGSVLRRNTELTVNLSSCNIDDHSFDLMMGELSKHAVEVNKGAVLNIIDNNISASCIASALQKTTIKAVRVGGMASTDEGALSLVAALAANSSLEDLRLYWSSVQPGSTLKKIGEHVNRSTLKRLELALSMLWDCTELNEWLNDVEAGIKTLLLSLEDSQLKELHYLYYVDKKYLLSEAQIQQIHQPRHAFQSTATMINEARAQKGLPCISIYYNFSYQSPLIIH